MNVLIPMTRPTASTGTLIDSSRQIPICLYRIGISTLGDQGVLQFDQCQDDDPDFVMRESVFRIEHLSTSNLLPSYIISTLSLPDDPAFEYSAIQPIIQYGSLHCTMGTGDKMW